MQAAAKAVAEVNAAHSMARRFHRQESPRVTVSFPFFRKPVCGKCCRYSLLCTRMPSTGVLWWLMLCGRRGQTWTDCEVTQRLGDWQRQRDQCTLPPIHIRVAGPSHGMPANPHGMAGCLKTPALTLLPRPPGPWAASPQVRHQTDLYTIYMCVRLPCSGHCHGLFRTDGHAGLPHGTSRHAAAARARQHARDTQGH